MPKAKKEKQIIKMNLSIKKVDMENHIISGSFSNENMDRHGEVVYQNWDLKNFKKNPVILNSHNYGDITEILGKAINLDNNKDKKELIGDIQFAVSQNPKAKIAFDLYAGGFANAFSVGFIPLEFDKDGNILKSELLEISLVSVPANALALAKSKGIEVEKLYETKSDGYNEETEEGFEGGSEPDDSEGSGDGGDTEPGEPEGDSEGERSEEELDEEENEESDEETIDEPVEEQIEEEKVEEVKFIKQTPSSVIHNAVKSEVEKRKLALQKIYSAVKLVSEKSKVVTRQLDTDDRAKTRLLINRTIRELYKLK